MLSWEQIEARAVAFQKQWRDCRGDERQEGQTFGKDFMNVFGADFREGLHEHQIYLQDGSDLSGRIMLLFSMLNTPEENRMVNTAERMKGFRHINGSLFSEPLPPAFFDAKMRETLLECCEFNWS